MTAVLELFPPGSALADEGTLTVAGCRLDDLAAEFGTPVLVVDETALRQRARDYLAAFRSRWPLSDVAFASKAFPCTAIQRLMVEEGLHLDVAGGGEIMTALAAGRGISLPSQSSAGAAYCARATGAYARIREQFHVPIGKFEGIEEPLARIAVHRLAVPLHIVAPSSRALEPVEVDTRIERRHVGRGAQRGTDAEAVDRRASRSEERRVGK